MWARDDTGFLARIVRGFCLFGVPTADSGEVKFFIFAKRLIDADCWYRSNESDTVLGC